MMLEQKKVSKEEKVIAVQYMVDFMHLSSYHAKESNVFRSWISIFPI